MSSRIRLLVFASLAIVSVNVAIGTSGAGAAERDWGRPVAQHRRHVVHAHGRPSHFAGRRVLPPYGYGDPAVSAGPPFVFRGPGYVFVPGRGILDEACNLPTSACPNSERDIQ